MANSFLLVTSKVEVQNILWLSLHPATSNSLCHLLKKTQDSKISKCATDGLPNAPHPCKVPCRHENTQ